jgi:hypothetical protein
VHLEVLREARRWRGRIGEGGGDAGPIDGLLGHSVDHRRQLHPDRVENGGEDVNGVTELRAHSPRTG